MPLSISDLPRADGIVRGNFRARHRSKTFSLQGYGFHFVRGVTGTLRGRIADRLHAAYGKDVTFEPCDVDSALLALGWMRGRGQPEARVSRIEGLLEQLFMREDEPPEEPESRGEDQPGAAGRKEGPPPSPPPASTGPAEVPADVAAPAAPSGGGPEPVTSEPSGPHEGSEKIQPQAPASTKPAEAPSAGAAPAAKPDRPKTAAELEALSDDALRAVAADLGVTDKRWSVQRLRRFVADELGIGEQA